MPDWLGEVLKYLSGALAALVAVWVAQINRGASLAETLRQEQADIRDELHRQIEALAGQLETERRRNDALQGVVMALRAGNVPIEWQELLRRIDGFAPLYPPMEDV